MNLKLLSIEGELSVAVVSAARVNLARSTSKHERSRRTGDAAQDRRDAEFTRGPQAKTEDIRFICLFLCAADQLILSDAERMVQQRINGVF